MKASQQSEIYGSHRSGLGVSFLAIIFIFFISIESSLLGCIFSSIYALFLLFSSSFVLNKKYLLGMSFIFPALIFSSLISKYFNLTLYFVESAKILAWLSVLIIISRMSLSSLGAAMKFFTLLVFSSYIFIPWQLDRLAGFFPHPNHLAYVCSFLILWWSSCGQVSGRFNYFIIIGLVLIVVLTKSSNGLLCALVALIPIAASKGKLNLKSIISAIFVISALALASYWFGLFDDIYQKISSALSTDLIEKAENQSFGSEGSFAWRVSYWLAILMEYYKEGFGAHLFGIGAGLMGAGNYFYEFMIVDPHNEFVRFLVERGVVGLLAIIYLLYAIFSSSSKGWYIFLIIVLQAMIGNPLVFFPTMICLFCVTVYFMKIEDLIGKGVANE